jgi:hypothetical protein
MPSEVAAQAEAVADTVAASIAEAQKQAQADDDAGALARLTETRARVAAAGGAPIEQRWLAFEMACCAVFLDQPEQAFALLAESARHEPTLRALAYADPRLASVRYLPAFVAAVGGRGGPVLPYFPRVREQRVMLFDQTSAPLLCRSMRVHGWQGPAPITFSYSTSGGKNEYPSEIALADDIQDCVMSQMSWFMNNAILTGKRDALRLTPPDGEHIKYTMRFHAGTSYDEVLAGWQEEEARIIHGADYSARVADLDTISKLLAAATAATSVAALVEAVADHPQRIADTISVAESIAAARGWDLLPDVAAMVEARLASDSKLDPSMLLFAIEHSARLHDLGPAGQSLGRRLAARRQGSDADLYFSSGLPG